MNQPKRIITPLIIIIISLWLTACQPQPYNALPSSTPAPWGEIALTPEEELWLQSHSTVQVHIENWPPFMIYKNGKASGIAMDTLKLLLDQVGLQPEYEESLWADALQEFEDHTGPEILPVVARTAEREEMMYLTSDYISFPLVIITQKNAPFVSSVDDLTNHIVAVEKSFTAYNKLMADYPHIQLLVTDTTLEALQAVSTSKADAYIGNLAVASYLIQEHGLINLKVAAPSSFDDHKMAIGIRMDQPELASILEKTLNAMPVESRDQIKQEWLFVRYEYGISQKDVWVRIAATVVVAVIILGFAVFSNQRLEMEVAETRKAQLALAESESLLRHILDANPATIFLIDGDGKFILANQGAAEHYQTTVEEMIGKSRYAFMGLPEQREEFSRFEKEDQEVIASQHSLLIPEERFTLADGTQRWLQTYKIPITLQSGRKCVLVFSLNITARREAEIALAESETLLRSVIDATPDVIFVKDDKGNFILVNRAGAALYNMTPQQMQGLNEIDLIDLADAEVDVVDMYIKTDRQVINENTAMIFPEEQISRRSMGTRWFRTSKIPLETQGKTDKVLVVSTDITERKLALEALKQERASLAQRVEERTAELVQVNIELQESSRAKDEFLANMSHELRTPLNAILGMSEILEEQLFGQLNDKQLKHIKVIEESGRHLLTLINDILDLAKIESGQRELFYQPVHISDLCASSLNFINAQAIKKNISVTYEPGLGLTDIEADPRSLKQILVNLLSNAIKFTPENGQIGLQVEQDEKTETVCFTVWDTGIGITPEQSLKLFRPFVQVDSGLTRNYEGTGLGLSLISRLVDMHGGSVQLKSSGIHGDGSHFTIHLPFHPLDIQTRLKPEFEGVKILLMDDETNSRLRMQNILTRLGCQVQTTQTNHDAIRVSREMRPEMIFIDTQIPQESTLQTILQIRQELKNDSIPIISMTSLMIQQDPALSNSFGTHEYLLKPLSPKKIKKLLEKYLPKK